jgi:hypothetical protein
MSDFGAESVMKVAKTEPFLMSTFHSLLYFTTTHRRSCQPDVEHSRHCFALSAQRRLNLIGLSNLVLGQRGTWLLWLQEIGQPVEEKGPSRSRSGILLPK